MELRGPKIYSFRLKINEIRERAKECKRRKRHMHRELYKRLGLKTEILTSPCVYIWAKNEDVLYIGKTIGGSQNRPYAIISSIAGFPSVGHDKVGAIISEFSEDDFISIHILLTQNASSLEKCLISNWGKPLYNTT